MLDLFLLVRVAANVTEFMIFIVALAIHHFNEAAAATLEVTVVLFDHVLHEVIERIMLFVFIAQKSWHLIVDLIARCEYVLFHIIIHLFQEAFLVLLFNVFSQRVTILCKRLLSIVFYGICPRELRKFETNVDSFPKHLLCLGYQIVLLSHHAIDCGLSVHDLLWIHEISLLQKIHEQLLRILMRSLLILDLLTEVIKTLVALLFALHGLPHLFE